MLRKAILAMRWRTRAVGSLWASQHMGENQPVHAVCTQREVGAESWARGTEGHTGLSLRIPGFSLLVVMKATHSGFLGFIPLGMGLDGSSKLFCPNEFSQN